MSEAAERRNDVVDMAQYLRDTIAEIDDAVANLLARRQGFAVRLAALEASSDPAVIESAADFEIRVASSRPYEKAEDAVALLSEAHRRYGM